jgi:5-methylcytosine-specific restriction endonuclease McrA
VSLVFVLDTNKQPLASTSAPRARILLSSGKAAVYRRYPFTIILKRAIEHSMSEPLRLKLDPGSKTTGLAIVNDTTGQVVFAAEITHRGQQIKRALADRRTMRHNRRQRQTRYRKPRFHNRSRHQNWIAPSLLSRVRNTLTWVQRLTRLCPIVAISQELVKFDLQLMDNPEVSGKQYQQGTLAGYEAREYLLCKWQHACAYCGATQVPLHLEHIHPRAKGGTNRISNLALACQKCNQDKGTQDIRTFLANQPERLERILAQAKTPMKDAAAVNSTRWLLYERLQDLGLPVETGSGGLTKYNRTKQGLPKAHWLDAACTGKSTPAFLHIEEAVPLFITANGHGCRQMCLMDAHGFPRSKSKGAKKVRGFQTGDLVKAMVPSGKKAGTYVGRVAIRTRGSFNITTAKGKVQDVSYRFCSPLHRHDGYSYTYGKEAAFPLIP